MKDQLSARNVAYVNSQIACAMVELEAMKAENAQRERNGEALAWSYNEFLNLIDKYQMSHNATLANLNAGQ